MAAPVWILDESIAFLNHGSFGACPQNVLDVQREWRDRMEREPVRFLDRDLEGLLDEARNRVCAFLGADPSGFVFVPNATAGANAVFASIGLERGDRVVTTSHAYGAVRHALAVATRRAGAALDIVDLPLPLPDDDALHDLIVGGIGPRTKLVVVDAVCSPTGAVLPADRVVASCRNIGVAVLVDGAHAPGSIHVDLRSLGADFWIGNFHKWVCAPKGSAGLWVAPEHRDAIRPVVVSHDYLTTFHHRFGWTGTHDPTPYLATPAAIELFADIGWDALMTRNRDLAEAGRSIVAAAIGASRLVAASQQASMTAVPLDDLDPAAAKTLQASLFAEAKIEAALTVAGSRVLIRLSAHLYNKVADFERLAGALQAR